MEKPDLTQYPLTPGVYLYKDAGGRIIYVGKARRLRQRLASYFQETAALPVKTRLMLSHATSITVLQTATEKEALLLEASLIKKHRPRYNIVLRDDKEYLLFRIGDEHPYPRVEVVRHNSRSRKNRRGKFFGPFSSGTAARETWKLIHKYFPLRRCRDAAFANRTRPCLYHHMGQCLGPCTLPVDQAVYRAMLHKVEMLLSGRSSELITTLRQEMAVAAEGLQFEKAARLRDQIRAVERTVERQSVVLPPSVSLDIIGVAQVPEGLALGIVFVRDGLLLDGRNFFWPALCVEDTPELLYSFLSQYYLTENRPLPPRIVVPWLPANEDQPFAPALRGSPSEPSAQAVPGSAAQNTPESLLLEDTPPESQANALEALPPESAQEAPVQGTSESAQESPHGLLVTEAPEASVQPQGWEEMLDDLLATLAERRGGPVALTTPRGMDEDRLALMAATNARDAVQAKQTVPMAERLAARLHSPKPLERIEVVDISHTGGRQTRAGMVVFHHEEPVPHEFRTYSMDEGLEASGAEAGDDYAALALWAARRAAAGLPWADLVLIDGGKGQLQAVHRAFAEAGVGDQFLLAAIAKARDEDGKADRRAGNVGDRIFLPGRSNPLPLQAGSAELLFLQRVRDTVHDYVLGRHRQARAAATLTGELTRLPGIGPALARELFARFGSLAAMAEAGEEALRQVPGIGANRAAMLHKRLQALVQKK